MRLPDFTDYSANSAAKTTKPFADESNVNLYEKIQKARTALDTARQENLTAIDMELRYIRRDRQRRPAISNEKKHRARIKDAYYALNLIENAREQLNDIESSRELYIAMNKLTEALQIINNVYKNAEKPDERQYRKQAGRLDRNMEKDERLTESLYDREREGGIDALVSDDLVDLLLKGISVEDCLYSGTGIRTSAEELEMKFAEESADPVEQFNKKMEDYEADSRKDADYSDMDFTDFHFGDF